jgi:hypothetical protein
MLKVTFAHYVNVILQTLIMVVAIVLSFVMLDVIMLNVIFAECRK